MEKRNKNKKVILGIDPGSTKIGFGVISYINGKDLITYSKEIKPEVLGYGYIDIQKHNHGGGRLLQLYKDLKEILSLYKPDCLAIENIYFFKNTKTFTSVVQSKGVILFTAAQAKINIHEYTPLQIKQTISGYGRADKNFVQKLVRLSLNINSKITPDDASDALAIALCHIRHLMKS